MWVLNVQSGGPEKSEIWRVLSTRAGALWRSASEGVACVLLAATMHTPGAWMYIHICMYIYVYTLECMYIYSNICIYMYAVFDMCIYIYTVCIYHIVHMYVYILHIFKYKKRSQE